jgi:hypothetical protein
LPLDKCGKLGGSPFSRKLRFSADSASQYVATNQS